ncbi:FAD-binding protein [Hymenobacter lutimineralis]|uniref:FAD-binding protein n=1 Tax=Hymenobacter lutimineralis TaxID=2606448 RepID=A0A5D6UV13_9BACT|nr:FAD-binding protein [Hymenobacter lutimineralis]
MSFCPRPSSPKPHETCLPSCPGRGAAAAERLRLHVLSARAQRAPTHPAGRVQRRGPRQLSGQLHGPGRLRGHQPPGHYRHGLLPAHR